MAIYKWALNTAEAYRFWQNLASRRLIVMLARALDNRRMRSTSFRPRDRRMRRAQRTLRWNIFPGWRFACITIQLHPLLVSRRRFTFGGLACPTEQTRREASRPSHRGWAAQTHRSAMAGRIRARAGGG